MPPMYGSLAYAQQLRQVKASIVGAEQAERNTKNHAAKVARMLKEDSFSTAESLRACYYRLLDTYNYDKVPFVPGEKLPKLWTNTVFKAYEKSQSPHVEHYMKAQFQWFHAAFRTYPELKQLGTKAAIERANLYVPESTANITANVIDFKPDVAILMRNAEKQMQDLCKARNMSRSEVYRELVIPGIFIFPKEYLAADPEYRKCK